VSLAAVVEALRGGGVAAVPTDTVYGLAARIDRPEAIERLFELKRRPPERTLAVLVRGIDQAELLAELDDRARALIEAFWPGALTLVVPASSAAPASVVAPGGTVGVRAPDHPVIQRIIAELGPIVATSANLHDQPTPADAAGVAEQFPGLPVHDGGPCGSVASTVVRLDAGPAAEVQIVREGEISAAALRRCLTLGSPG